MPLVRRLRSRGANLTVVANAEVLFYPGGDLARWNNSLSQRVRRFAVAEAPSNKRPRWGHYSKPLKMTMRSATDIDITRMQAYTAVGSTAPYSAYVDQGTGVYAGNAPYLAKILPPWGRNSPSLYEHTWKVPTRGGTNPDGSGIVDFEEVGKITIKGQRGQFFMDRALAGGIGSMRVVTRSLPGSGGPIMSRALARFPDRLANFSGATPVDAAFMASLNEWRAWRDLAWNSGRVLGQGYNKERERREYRRTLAEGAREARRQDNLARRRQYSRERSARYRARQRANRPDRPRLNPRERAIAASRRERAIWQAKNPGLRVGVINGAGFYVRLPNGEVAFHAWSTSTADLFIDAGINSPPVPRGTRRV